MGKGRKVVRVSSASAATAIYGLSTYVAWEVREQEHKPPVSFKQVAIAAGAMTVLTWIAALA